MYYTRESIIMVRKIELEILADFHVCGTARNEKVALESCRSLCLQVYVYVYTCICMYMCMIVSLDNVRTVEIILFTFGM